MQWTDGSRFEGNWDSDMKNGIGTLYYENGDVYHGNWYNEK